MENFHLCADFRSIYYNWKLILARGDLESSDR